MNKTIDQYLFLFSNTLALPDVCYQLMIHGRFIRSFSNNLHNRRRFDRGYSIHSLW